MKRSIIEIDEDLCNGCGQCVPSCAEGAIQVIDGKARLVSETFCDGLGACLGECPTGALKIVERDADAYDEAAVETHLEREKKPAHSGCPGAQLRTFKPNAAPRERPEHSESALTHWPVQIRLVPPTAPFLRGADLLVTADCVPIAYPNFHQDFLDGKVVLVGCPKFDDVELYVQRFADIFASADIRSVTVVVMEVPCCQALPMIIERGMRLVGAAIPVEKVVIGLNGERANQPISAMCH
jgi:Fe-S-cluster-containing hydrogenase component 2